MDFPAARRVFGALLADDGTDVDLPKVGDYILSRRLGHGGGGTVYVGHRADSDRDLAIKVLDRPLDGGRGAQRAWRELDILTQLRLPCTPQVHDYGVHEGCMYIATEHVDGAALSEYCRSHGLDRWQRVGLLANVADAVQSIHAYGVIHRDLKPDNILIDTRGEPVIIDLGIAGVLSGCDGESLTAEGVPIGTPGFMSPEQARGEREAISTRSDVYSLGATACYILTGQTPHDTDTSLHEAIRRVAQDPPRSPRALDPAMPKALVFVLAKAVSPLPEHRYTSAADFAEGLRRSIEAAGPSIVERARFWIRRHPDQMMWCTALIVAAAAALVLGVRAAGNAAVAQTATHVALDHEKIRQDYKEMVLRRETNLQERRHRQIQRVRMAKERGELFDATLVLLNLAEEIEAEQLDNKQALRRFTELLTELFDAVASERQTRNPDPGETD